MPQRSGSGRGNAPDHPRTALEQAVADGVSVAEGASLYYGAPALAFVLAASDQLGLTRAKAIAAAGTATVTRHRLEAAHRRIDQRQRPEYAEFDLIRGLTGLGVALRRIGDLDLLREVLIYLVRLTDPIGHLPGWWCRNGPHRDQSTPVGGHANHGMAHGISPLALLALTHLDGVHVDGHTEAIERILRWLDAWQQHTGDGAAWWPQTVTLTDLERGETTQAGPLRPSWCYGTPGIARAQQLAARALGVTTRQHNAETAFTHCVNDPRQIGRLIDRSLCHGTAGLLATGRRIAADALTPIPLAPLLRLHNHTTPHNAEQLAATRIAPTLLEAEHAGLISSWWFIRKRQWRIRYLAASDTAADNVFDALRAPGPWSWTSNVYEPETHAFGGPAGMDTAHALFHADSRHILSGTHDHGDRRKLTILLFTAMMRTAGLDWFEQGDVWARAVDLRPPTDLPDPAQWDSCTTATHRLLTVDTGPLRTDGSLEFAADWFTAFEQAGAALAALNRDGLLTRGLRAVIAHHTIFAWNRLGLPTQAQAAIAQASKEVILGEPTQNP